jgi:hypothetical protein
MKKQCSSSVRNGTIGALLSLIIVALSASAQLAITEVMSSATTRWGTNTVPQHSDFWELTNFGTNTIALDDYRFTDNGGVSTIDINADIFSGKQIVPGESIVLARKVSTVIETPEQFRAWWGLPTNVQIYIYRNPGFGAVGDAVQLFRVTATATTLVDCVNFLVATEGSTFTSHPETGEFGILSIAGQYGAFKATETDDIGSPGFSIGPVPLVITVQPQNTVVDGGGEATFSVQYHGLPRPHFQWRTNGVPIPGAILNTFTITAAQPTDAVNYSVELDNGLIRLVSSNATLIVNTNPSCARVAVPSTGCEAAGCAAAFSVYTNQTAILRASVRGYPLPGIQWQFNGTNIPGATNATLSIANATFGSAGTYTIRVTNLLCTNTATACLTVSRRPLLFVTEALSHASSNSLVSGHSDWWELTNFDTNAVNLCGYRFNEYPGPSLEGTFVVTNDITIRPGESIIFARQMSAEAFKNWWGEENLPENIQIIRYPGHNFDPEFDAIYFWNAGALDPDDHIAKAEFVNFSDGVTLWFDPFDPTPGAEFGYPSVIGEYGALRALEADDIGSPGWATNHPPRPHIPRFTSLTRGIAGANLTWTARPGKRYELQFKSALLSNLTWTALSQHSATGLSVTTLDMSATNANQRFYRLQVLPDMP